MAIQEGLVQNFYDVRKVQRIWGKSSSSCVTAMFLENLKVNL